MLWCHGMRLWSLNLVMRVGLLPIKSVLLGDQISLSVVYHMCIPEENGLQTRKMALPRLHDFRFLISRAMRDTCFCLFILLTHYPHHFVFVTGAISGCRWKIIFRNWEEGPMQPWEAVRKGPCWSAAALGCGDVRLRIAGGRSWKWYQMGSFNGMREEERPA